MNYFEHQNQKPMSKIWSLFVSLSTMTPEQITRIYENSDYSHTLEIVRSALNGSIDLTDEAISKFNLGAYEWKCRENEKTGKRKRAKKELLIVDFDNSDEDSRAGFGEISSRKLSSVDDSFEEIMNNDEFESNLRELLNIRTKYIIEHNVDVVSVLLSALKGIPEAVASLKSLMADSKLSELIVGLCNSSGGDLIQRLEAVV